MKTLTYEEKGTLIKQLVKCEWCDTMDGVEISHGLLDDHYVIWCGCGRGTDSHDSFEEALVEWKELNEKPEG